MEAKDMLKMVPEFTTIEDQENIDEIEHARQIKFQNIAAMVRAGIYEVDSKKVAEKLLKILF